MGAGDGDSSDPGPPYRPLLGATYLFNVILGVGALALPLAFEVSGFLLASLFLLVVAFFAYVTLTFVTECMAIANAFAAHEQHESATPLLSSELKEPVSADLFDIARKTELMNMAHTFLPAWGHRALSVCISLYLFGDLAIYAVTIVVSLSNFTGTLHLGSWVIDGTSTPCHDGGDVYYFFLVAFSVVALPFAYSNIQKQKLLHAVSLVMRYFSFFAMIAISISFLASNCPNLPSPSQCLSLSNARLFDLSGLTVLFGVAIYAFMCHHSLPAIIAPINSKRRLNSLTLSVFAVIYALYISFSLIGLFAFAGHDRSCSAADLSNCTIKSVFTLNFRDYRLQWLAAVLILYPVITLIPNFLLISITLRNNIAAILTRAAPSIPAPLLRAIAPLLAVVPALIVAFATRNIGTLINVTGSVAGLGIMYLAPSFMVMEARRRARATFGVVRFDAESPFRHRAWPVAVLVWAAATLPLTIWNIYLRVKSSSC